MQVEGAHHVSINLASVEDAERFYEKLLGLHPIERPDFGIPGVWYQAGSIQLHVIVPPAGVEVGTRAPSLNPVASHIAFEIRDYEAAREALEREGVEILGLGAEVGQLFVRDPGGNIVELIQPGGRLGRKRDASGTFLP